MKTNKDLKQASSPSLEMRKPLNNNDCYYCLLIALKRGWSDLSYSIKPWCQPLTFIEQMFLLSHNNQCTIHFIFLPLLL